MRALLDQDQNQRHFSQISCPKSTPGSVSGRKVAEYAPLSPLGILQRRMRRFLGLGVSVNTSGNLLGVLRADRDRRARLTGLDGDLFALGWGSGSDSGSSSSTSSYSPSASASSSSVGSSASSSTSCSSAFRFLPAAGETEGANLTLYQPTNMHKSCIPLTMKIKIDSRCHLEYFPSASTHWVA